MTLRVLDLTPGNRGIWFDKEHPCVTFAPTDCNGFSLIVLDPPHANVGASSNMTKDYGHHTAAEIREFIVSAAQEAHHRSITDAIMAFKWNDHDRKLTPILALMAPWWEPLFGQRTAIRTKHACSTYWVMLLRRGGHHDTRP